MSRWSRAWIAALSVGAVTCLAVVPARAIEGGTGAYILGSRDSLSGIAPPPGTTVITNGVWHFDARGPTIGSTGLRLANPKADIYLNKFDIAHVFNTQILGGTPGVNLTIPYTSGTLTADGRMGGRLVGELEDRNYGFGDPVLTPGIGWHAGNFHWITAVSIFLPWGKYELASATPAPPAIDNFLNFGKNRASFLPTFSFTWLDPKIGLELSAALSFEFSLKNHATNWQSAPAVILELAALRHWSNGFALGVVGYAYQQIGEDSGFGAERFKAAVGASSLEARVFSVGPIATYSTKFGTTPVRFKLKYVNEFGAKQRFESKVVTGAFTVSF